MKPPPIEIEPIVYDAIIPVLVSSSAARNKVSNDKEESEIEELTPLVQEADPEFEKLLDEEEQIAKLTNSKNQTPIFRPGEVD